MMSALVRFSIRFSGVIIGLATLVVLYGFYSLTRSNLDVFPEFEHAAIVGANAFEHAVAIKQPVIEDRHLCVPLVEVFAVNKNFHAQTTESYEEWQVNANVNFVAGVPRSREGLELIARAALFPQRCPPDCLPLN